MFENYFELFREWTRVLKMGKDRHKVSNKNITLIFKGGSQIVNFDR